MAFFVIKLNRREMSADEQARRRRSRIVAMALAAVVGLVPSGANAVITPTLPGYLPASFKLLNNRSISGNSTLAVAIIGGSTTVPHAATSVQLSLKITSKTEGELILSPYGGGPNHHIVLGAGTTTATTTVNVGLKDEAAFKNFSSQPVSVTATIIGYSIQAPAGPAGGLHWYHMGHDFSTLDPVIIAGSDFDAEVRLAGDELSITLGDYYSSERCGVTASAIGVPGVLTITLPDEEGDRTIRVSERNLDFPGVSAYPNFMLNVVCTQE